MDDRAASSHETLTQQMRRAARQLRSAAFAAEAKYNPNWAAQPRIPGGNPEGGQWTSGGGRPSGAPSRGQQRRILPARQGDSSASWRLLRREALVDGTGERTLHRADDGTKILTERRTGLVTGARTSRHVVQMPDGGSLLVDNDRHGVQRIQGADGALISASRWGPNGPEPVAVRQSAFSDGRTPKLPGKVGMVLRGAIMLWNLLSERVEQGKTPVIVGRPREYSPSGDNELVPELVGEIDRDEADGFCKRYPEVRYKLSEIAKRTRVGFTGTEREFGSQVHHRMAKYINDQGSDDFVAEVTNDPANTEKPLSRRRYKGSTFLDIYERASKDTVCVYDHKTGRAGLSAARAKKLARTAFRIHRGATRILIIEVRPGL